MPTEKFGLYCSVVILPLIYIWYPFKTCAMITLTWLPHICLQPKLIDFICPIQLIQLSSNPWLFVYSPWPRRTKRKTGRRGQIWPPCGNLPCLRGRVLRCPQSWGAHNLTWSRGGYAGGSHSSLTWGAEAWVCWRSW